MISNKLKLATLTSAAAAAMSMPVLSAVDIDATTDQKLKYADELKGTVPASGYVIARNLNNAQDVAGAQGISTNTAAATKFYRFDLTNALFEDTPGLVVKTGANLTTCDTNATVALAAGGDGESFATFQVTAVTGKVMGATCDFTLAPNTGAAKGLSLDPTGTVSVKYRQFDTLGQTTQDSFKLIEKTVDIAEFIAGSAPAGAITAQDATATVASDFQLFNNAVNGVANGSLTTVGKVIVADVIPTGVSTIKLDGTAAAAADFLTAGQTVTLTGDVSEGVWTSQTAANCTGGTIACVKNAANSACTVTATAANADMYFCAQFSGLATGVKAPKSGYSIAYGTDTDLTGALGSVVYDTVTVEVPYITTFEGYNQRIFIDNFGATSASYSTTFTTETGVTATAGSAATGTLAAGAVSTVKVADMVTFAGGSRGTATLELEANGANLRIVSQIVDLGTGMTDTILLHPSTQQ